MLQFQAKNDFVEIPKEAFLIDLSPFSYRSSSHSNIIRLLFPDCNGGGRGCGGVDLPKLTDNGLNGEIKESRQTHRTMITLHLKDLIEGDFFLFLHWDTPLMLYLLYIDPNKKMDIANDMEIEDKEKIGFGKKWINEKNLFKWSIPRTKMKKSKLNEIRGIINDLRSGNFENFPTIYGK